MTITRRHMLTRTAAFGAAAAMPAPAARSATPPPSVERWGLYEIVLDGPREGNPFDDVDVSAVFEGWGARIKVPGFYDGDGVYRIRFSPPEMGQWRWTTDSNAAVLAGRSGRFEATAPSKGNHGPVRISKDGYHFVHADGTPFRQIGTTCYSWALQSDAKCAETLQTLAGAPFNKMRMLVSPNVDSVATDPFVRTGPGLKDWDATRFDPAYFRRYEDRIEKLGALGIEADVILYHPYDEKRGYNDMKREDDERYIRYVAARFGAYRNVWWSMANEYDKVDSKSVADWDHLFETLIAADPHDRLRSIHHLNIYYDHRKPWITHASVQNGAAVLDDLRAELHRALTLKPVIFDEVIYEGNLAERWGDLTGEQLVQRFWYGLIGGTYVGHSETHDPQRKADNSWLGKGGKLVGTSAPRLAFLRHIMEDGPIPGIEPLQPWWNYHIGGKQNEYFLKYFGSETPTQWELVLPGRGDPALQTYRADIIDSWNMTITPVQGVFKMARKNAYDVYDPNRPVVTLPGKPWMAVRLRRV